MHRHEWRRGTQSAQCHLVFRARCITETLHSGYVLNMDTVAVFGLYVQLAPAELFRLLQRQMGRKVRSGIYSARLVIWMMISQRLQARGTLASSVEQLVQGRFDPLLSQCKRAREKKIGLSTGGYCLARQHLPKLLISRSMDELVERLRGRLLESASALPQRVYLLDGSSLQLEHEPELVQAFPPASNQHGKSHWPVLRMVVLHDLETGLAERPCWGPLNGARAVSEQALAERAMQPLPAGSVVVGDRNFGIFSTAYHAQQRGHGTVLRMTAARAQALMGGPISQPGDYPVGWRPSRWDGKKGQPAWPAEASLQGRLIAWRVGRGKHQQWLYLFTTLALPAAEVVELYGRRWRIGVSSQGHIIQSVRDRPRSIDSDLVAGEAAWRESKTAKPSDNMLRKECAQRTRLQRAVNADVASLHEFPVAETVDNARKQQELAETSPKRQFSPAGYQRRHGVKDDVETGEALGARRRNLVEEMSAITVSGKC